MKNFIHSVSIEIDHYYSILFQKYPFYTFVCLATFIYFYSLFNYFVGDDFDQLVNNPFVHSLKNLPYFFLGGTFNNGFVSLSGIYYKPIMTIIFSSLYTLFGTTSFFYHFIQLLFHILNTYLLFLLFSKLLNTRVAFVCALLFLVHPINAEAVLYISNLQDVLYSFFGLLGLNILLSKYFSNNQKKIYSIYKILFITHSLFLLSLLSKETGILYLFISFFFTLVFYQKIIFPHTIATGVTISIYALMRLNAVGFYNYQTEHFPMIKLDLIQRLINIPEIVFYYLSTFIYPVNLAFNQNWVVREITVEQFFIPLILDLLFFTVLLAIGWTVKRDKTQLRLFFFFFGWFLVGLLLHLQLLPLDMTVADRWFYFPIIGLLGIIGITLTKSNPPILKEYSKPILLVLLCILALLTFIRSLNWQNQYTLYSHDIQYNQQSYSLENGYGLELMNKGRYIEAENFVRRSIALEPDFCFSWNNLGTIYIQKKEFQKAREYYQTAIERGGCVIAYNNLATLLYYHFDINEAHQFTQTALKEVPQSSRLWLMLSLQEYKLGHQQEAIAAIKKSLAIEKTSAGIFVYQNLIQNKPFELREQ